MGQGRRGLYVRGGKGDGGTGKPGRDCGKQSQGKVVVEENRSESDQNR